MKDYPIDHKRTLALVGQHGAGKTTLVEALLFNQGVIARMGSVDAGNTFCDFTKEEKEHKFSIHATLVRLEPKDHIVYLIDTPGFADFVGDIKSAMQAVDTAALVVSAAAGVEVETERVYEFSREFNQPIVAIINGLDRERADFAAALDSIQRHFDGIRVAALTLPIGAESNLRGVVDLLTQQALTFDDKGNIKERGPVPADMAELVAEHREALIDAVAEATDELTERYLENGTLEDNEIRNGLRISIAERKVMPVLAMSAAKLIGVQTLIDAVLDLLPPPNFRAEIVGHEPGHPDKPVRVPVEGDKLCAQVYQVLIDPFSGRQAFARVYAGVLQSDHVALNATRDQTVRIGNLGAISGGAKPPVLPRATAGDIVGILKVDNLVAGDTLCDPSLRVQLPSITFPKPVIMMAVHTQDRKDDEKLGTVLPRVTEIDRCLNTRREPETHELLLEGQGDLQLNIAVEMLKELGVNVELKIPRVPYKETITAKGEGSYRHKKQSGGRGQFGEVHLRLEPLNNGEHFEFVDEIVGGAIPGRFIPAVEKGVLERMGRGVLAGYPMTGVRVAVFFGKYHDVDSDEMSFKTAASICMRDVALQRCRPVLLEPIYRVTVTVPEEYLGDVMGDLNARRGRVLGMEGVKGKQQIKATAPLAELFRYSIDLRSLTRGRGAFEMEFSHYEVVPREIADKVIAAAAKHEEEE